MKIHALPFALLLAAYAVAAPATDSGRRGVTPEDYYAFENIGDVRVSPDGRTVAYTVVSVDRKANRRNSEVWLAGTDGAKKPAQFTTGASSRNPRWSPDGRSLAFIAVRPDPAGKPSAAKPQVNLLSMDGGEARRLSNLENGADSFAWSPDGRSLACLSKVLDPNAPKKNSSDVRHYLSATYKFNDTGWFDDRRSHIFVVDAATGAARQITSSPTRNDTDPQWSPDGRQIAFASEDTASPMLRNNDIYVVASSGGTLTRITADSGMCRAPRWSPDGQRLVFMNAPTENDVPKIWIRPVSAGGKAALAAPSLDMSVAEIEWDSNNSLLFSAGYHGESQAYRLNLASGKTAAATQGPRSVHHVDFNGKAGTLAYAANDFKHLDDLYVADAQGHNERQLTHLNTALWSRLELADVERVPYKAQDGTAVDGFFVKPVGWQPGKKYPLVLSIHGGPAGMYGVDWFHEFQCYAARGWAVFFTNPRGSTGYGEKFQRAVEMNWGKATYTDIMTGVDVALDKYPWVDRDRLGVTGGSFGGFMTNWIVGHTDRFKAAVTLRSISNFISDEGTRDGYYGHARDFGGDVFNNFEYYWDSSPLKYAKNVKTPTLVLHSDNDYRVPLEQGEQWFRALKHFGVTSEFVIFPRENHNLTRNGEPKHLIESLNWQIYWFNRFLDGNENAVRPNVETKAE